MSVLILFGTWLLLFSLCVSVRLFVCVCVRVCWRVHLRACVCVFVHSLQSKEPLQTLLLLIHYFQLLCNHIHCPSNFSTGDTSSYHPTLSLSALNLSNSDIILPLLSL